MPLHSVPNALGHFTIEFLLQFRAKSIHNQKGNLYFELRIDLEDTLGESYHST